MTDAQIETEALRIEIARIVEEAVGDAVSGLSQAEAIDNAVEGILSLPTIAAALEGREREELTKPLSGRTGSRKRRRWCPYGNPERLKFKENRHE